MSALDQTMHVIDSHYISNRLLDSKFGKCGGLIDNGQYAWFVSGANVIIYSKQLGAVVSSKSFAGNQKDKSLQVTCIKELKNNKDTCNFILVGCSFKSSGILFVCQFPTLTTIHCISIPYPITDIATIMNELLDDDQLCDEFKIMSTILLIGMNTGAVYAVDLRKNFIEKQLRRNEVVVNELRPNKLFMWKIGDYAQEMKDDMDSHLVIFLNENFYSYIKNLVDEKLNFKVSSLLYIEEINTIAIGYSTGHLQLWDCKIMHTIYLLREPKSAMPVTHINFLEPSDDSKNLCYLWIIQSDNTGLPNATMIVLAYKRRIKMPNGCLSYRTFQGSDIKLELSLERETGIGRCISALSLCNVNLFSNEIDNDKNHEVRLFSMLIEVRQNAEACPESFIFLFDINQWYKAQMPSNITHLQLSNSYASFVKLPHNFSYLDFNISDKTLHPFRCNFRDNVGEFYYPSSIYFECDCLIDSKIIRFKHAGLQQEILDQLLLKSWRLLINPSLVFEKCIHANLKPFFWNKTDDYINYSLPDQRSFVISILVENKIMSVISACAEEWKNGTYASREATILHLVQCLWNHVIVVKQYADKLCVPLFDYSTSKLDKKNERILNCCLSQMLCVKHFFEGLLNVYGVHIIDVNYSYRVHALNLITQYFKTILCFINYGLLPESIEQHSIPSLIQCDFTHLIQYSNKRRMEFGDSQSYLIDAIINNEPKGKKIIEQWQHEGGEETNGMYPPSNIQSLLRIYLNADLSDQVKYFITIYFLIDICSKKRLNVKVIDLICKFSLEIDVPNKGLNTLCQASWLLDHDMFQEAMDILAKNKEWKTFNDNSWGWFHWVILKLLVFKSEYFWAQYYMKLVNINIVNIEDHKFYINLQIMNNQFFEAIRYMRERPLEEKLILFDYFFDRCKEINKLKCLIEYVCEKEEEGIFFSYLKRFKDADSLTIQLLFLLQRGKYLEAIELNKSIDVITELKCNDSLKITSNLVNRFEKSLPKTMKKKSCGHPTFQSLYKKRDIVVKCINSDTKMFSITDRKKENIFEKRNSSSMSVNLSHIIKPSLNNIRKHSPTNDVIHHEKRQKCNDDHVSKVNEDKILRSTEKQVLDILNTPFVEKTIVSPSVTSYSSILKMKSAKNHKPILPIIEDEIPVSRTVLKFSQPYDDSKIVQFDSTNSLKKPPSNNSKMEESLNYNAITNKKSSIEDEKMDISEYFDHEKVNVLTGKQIEEIILLSDVDEEKETEISKSKLENTSLILNKDDTSIEIVASCFDENKAKVSQKSVQIRTEASSPQLQSYNENIISPNSNDTEYIKEHIINNDDDLCRIYRSSSLNSLDQCSVSDENDFESTKLSITLSNNKENSEDANEEKLNVNSKENNEKINVEQCITSLDNHVSIKGEMRSEVKTVFSEKLSIKSEMSSADEIVSLEDHVSIEGEMCEGYETILSEDEIVPLEDNVPVRGEMSSEDEIVSSEYIVSVDGEVCAGYETISSEDEIVPLEDNVPVRGEMSSEDEIVSSEYIVSVEGEVCAGYETISSEDEIVPLEDNVPVRGEMSSEDEIVFSEYIVSVEGEICAGYEIISSEDEIVPLEDNVSVGGEICAGYETISLEDEIVPLEDNISVGGEMCSDDEAVSSEDTEPIESKMYPDDLTASSKDNVSIEVEIVPSGDNVSIEDVMRSENETESLEDTISIEDEIWSGDKTVSSDDEMMPSKDSVFVRSEICSDDETVSSKDETSSSEDNVSIEDEMSSEDKTVSLKKLSIESETSSEDEIVSSEDNVSVGGGMCSDNKAVSSEDTESIESKMYSDDETASSKDNVSIENETVPSEDSISIEDKMSSKDEIVSSEDQEEKINLCDMTYTSSNASANSLELQTDKYKKSSGEENNLRQNFIESVEENHEKNNLKHDGGKSNDDESNLEQCNTKFVDKNENNDEKQQNDVNIIESDKKDSENKDSVFIKSNKFENLISCAFDLTEENHQPNDNHKNDDIESVNHNDNIIVDDENIIDSNIKNHEKVLNKTSHENKSINFEESKNAEIHIYQVENVGVNVKEEYSFTTNQRKRRRIEKSSPPQNFDMIKTRLKVKNETNMVLRKSKVNFLLNRSNLIDHENSSLVEGKSVRTLRRSRSVQSDPTLTFPLVKKKLRSSSGTKLLISDGKNSIKTDDFKEVLVKSSVSPVKIKKQSLIDSLESKNKRKYTKQVEFEHFESNSNESKGNLNDSDSTSKVFSPNTGNNSQHTLFTPAKRSGIKTTKETIVKVSANKQLSTFERRITRSQKSALDRSLQSTSIGRETIHKVLTSKPEKKILKKKSNKKN